VAAAVCGVGAILAAALIPAQPPRDCVGEVELKRVSLEATEHEPVGA
jgi:hypothetical protein